jgi:hypothetical protein
MVREVGVHEFEFTYLVKADINEIRIGILWFMKQIKTEKVLMIEISD